MRKNKIESKMGIDKTRTGSGKSIVGKSTSWKIKDVGGEKEINFFVVVELFRFLFYLWFADMIWMLSILLWPMCQSGYEMWRKFDTHGLIITIGDNRDADNQVEALDEEIPKNISGIKVLF